MKPFEMLEHTADIRIRAFGSTLEMLFSNAACGMSAYIFGEEIFSLPVLGHTAFQIVSHDRESLLVDWLSEILLLELSQSKAFTKFDINFPAQGELLAKAYYVSLAPLEDIKAVTYHNLKIELINGLWQATVTFDI